MGDEETQVLATDSFDREFARLTGFAPLPWQRRLYRDWFRQGCIPAALDLPTGLGKTAVMAIWYLAKRHDAELPRRLVYVVDRRAVVDQASEEAEKIRKRADDESLKISTLRGRLADNREWLEDPAAPAIIVGTVDMIGSRLLFEGYAMSRRMRPYAAGLLGVDTLVVLDESHLVPPFERLLEQIAHDRDGYGREGVFGPADAAFRAILPGFRLLPLSATGRARGDDVFRLDEEDHAHPIVQERLTAVKRLRFVAEPDAKALPERLAEEAWKLANQGAAAARILVYCHSREGAQKVKKAIEDRAKKAKAAIETALLTGARRVKEREAAKDRLAKLGFFSRGKAPKVPAFVIATAAGEVGVDLDADHMVMDLAPFERMVQRLGRVNRLGGKRSEIVVVEPAAPPQPKKKDAPTAAEERERIAWAAGRLLRRLPQIEEGVHDEENAHDASPGALVALKQHHPEDVRRASTPEPLHPPLTRPLVEAWALTSLEEHTGRPEVAPWLRGWVEDEPQATVLWRRFLPVRTRGGQPTEKEIAAFFAAAPPHLVEMLETRADHVAEVVTKRAKALVDKSANPAAGTVGEVEEPPLTPQTPVAFLLDRAGRYQGRFWTLDALAAAAKGNEKKAFIRAIANRYLVLDARLGGLDGDGLLDPKKRDEADAADDADGWIKEANGEECPLVPFRVRRVKVAAEEEGDGDSNWRPVHAFDEERDADGAAVWRLVVEKWADAAGEEDQRSVLRVAQTLAEHLAWVRAQAEDLVERLGLAQAAPALAEAVVCAAALHDLGKKAPRWQRAFNAPERDDYGNPGPFAKTKGPFQSGVLGGYRHEFGSLLYLAREEHPEFAALPAEMQDLVRHLIVAHHGFARPLIRTDGCAGEAPSRLDREARDVALRFARLQKRFGPWGLAWLEALVRAADQRASRRLEEEARRRRAGRGSEKAQATPDPVVGSAGSPTAAVAAMRGQETGGPGHG